MSPEKIIIHSANWKLFMHILADGVQIPPPFLTCFLSGDLIIAAVAPYMKEGLIIFVYLKVIPIILLKNTKLRYKDKSYFYICILHI